MFQPMHRIWSMKRHYELKIDFLKSEIDTLRNNVQQALTTKTSPFLAKGLSWDKLLCRGKNNFWVQLVLVLSFEIVHKGLIQVPLKAKDFTLRVLYMKTGIWPPVHVVPDHQSTAEQPVECDGKGWMGEEELMLRQELTVLWQEMVSVPVILIFSEGTDHGRHMFSLC